MRIYLLLVYTYRVLKLFQMLACVYTGRCYLEGSCLYCEKAPSSLAKYSYHLYESSVTSVLTNLLAVHLLGQGTCETRCNVKRSHFRKVHFQKDSLFKHREANAGPSCMLSKDWNTSCSWLVSERKKLGKPSASFCHVRLRANWIRRLKSERICAVKQNGRSRKKMTTLCTRIASAIAYAINGSYLIVIGQQRVAISFE